MYYRKYPRPQTFGKIWINPQNSIPDWDCTSNFLPSPQTSENSKNWFYGNNGNSVEKVKKYFKSQTYNVVRSSLHFYPYQVNKTK